MKDDSVEILLCRIHQLYSLSLIGYVKNTTPYVMTGKN